MVYLKVHNSIQIQNQGQATSVGTFFPTKFKRASEDLFTNGLNTNQVPIKINTTDVTIR